MKICASTFVIQDNPCDFTLGFVALSTLHPTPHPTPHTIFIASFINCSRCSAVVSIDLASQQAKILCHQASRFHRPSTTKRALKLDHQSGGQGRGGTTCRQLTLVLDSLNCKYILHTASGHVGDSSCSYTRCISVRLDLLRSLFSNTLGRAGRI